MEIYQLAPVNAMTEIKFFKFCFILSSEEPVPFLYVLLNNLHWKLSWRYIEHYLANLVWLYYYHDNILHNIHQLIDEISETIIVSSSLLVCMMCKSITIHLRVFF